MKKRVKIEILTQCCIDEIHKIDNGEWKKIRGSDPELKIGDEVMGDKIVSSILSSWLQENLDYKIIST